MASHRGDGDGYGDVGKDVDGPFGESGESGDKSGGPTVPSGQDASLNEIQQHNIKHWKGHIQTLRVAIKKALTK